MKRLLMLPVIGLFNSQILWAQDTLSQSEVVNTVLRERIPQLKPLAAEAVTLRGKVANRDGMHLINNAEIVK